MRIIRMADVSIRIVDDIAGGCVFVYPTDTVYGIGCSAINDDAVRRVYAIKKRDESMPLSVIAPSFRWIEDNCLCDMNAVRKYLPGPYTVILKKKDAGSLKRVSAGGPTIGVRIINHPMMTFFEKSGVPVVTTSVNISGEAPVRSIDDIPAEMKRKIDFAIDDGVIDGKPSKVLDLTVDDETVLRE